MGYDTFRFRGAGGISQWEGGKEAIAYFEIGIKRLREICKDPACSFVITTGEKKTMVIRTKLEEYIAEHRYIWFRVKLHAGNNWKYVENCYLLWYYWRAFESRERRTGGEQSLPRRGWRLMNGSNSGRNSVESLYEPIWSETTGRGKSPVTKAVLKCRRWQKENL